MSKQIWTETLWWVTGDATAVASTTSETVLFPNITIPANYMQDGRNLRLRAIGKYSTTGTPTMIFTLRWNGVAGTVICKTAACTTPSGVTNAMWDLDILLSTRSNGSSGTVMGNGRAVVYAAVAGTVASATGNGLDTPMTNGGVVTPAAASLDLTTDTPLSLTLTWSASSASNTATGLQYIGESLN